MVRKSHAPKSQNNSTDARVFVPRGSVREAEILKAALLSAQSAIPPAAMNVHPRIVSASDIKTDDTGQEGRDYLVTITWTPRQVGAASTAQEQDETPGTVDKVLDVLGETLTPEAVTALSDEAGTA